MNLVDNSANGKVVHLKARHLIKCFLSTIRKNSGDCLPKLSLFLIRDRNAISGFKYLNLRPQDLISNFLSSLSFLNIIYVLEFL